MLQRSVTLIRRLLCTLPNESIRRWDGAKAGDIGGPFHGPQVARVVFSPVWARSKFHYIPTTTRASTAPRMHPFLGPVGPDFLFPDGDDVFQGVDQPAARLKRLLAVRATDGDHDADFAQF